MSPMQVARYVPYSERSVDVFSVVVPCAAQMGMLCNEHIPMRNTFVVKLVAPLFPIADEIRCKKTRAQPHPVSPPCSDERPHILALPLSPAHIFAESESTLCTPRCVRGQGSLLSKGLPRLRPFKFFFKHPSSFEFQHGTGSPCRGKGPECGGSEH